VTARERDLRVGGLRLRVREVGEGPAVLLVNGIGAHVEMWRPLERTLTDRRVVSFDAPGTGASQTPSYPLTMSRLAALVEELADRLSLDRVDVVGYSFGGVLAQAFALRRPARVRRLVLAATFPGWGGVPGQLAPMLAMTTPLRYWSRRFYEATAPTVAGGRTRTDPEHVRRLWNDRAGRPPSALGYAQQLWTLSSWSSLPFLPRLQAPTLILAGDDDPLVPLSNALLMASRIPTARVLVQPGEGHFMLLDDDGVGARAVAEFLSAPRVEDAPAWQAAVEVDHAEARDGVRNDGPGAFPWGTVSAVLRRAFT
jgi:poly(3-hydroxyoctanoate) depolymerase